MDNHDISIVLAVYNGEKYLVHLLNSLLKQEGVDIKEIIIVDDCSTDHSVEIINDYINKYSFIKLRQNTINSGPVTSFVMGAALAAGNYIAFADQDDIWVKNKLFLSLNLMLKTEMADKPCVIFSDLEMIDEEGVSIHRSFWEMHNIKPALNSFYTLLFGNIITGCTMLINRSMLREFLNMPLNVEMHDHWVALVASAFGHWSYIDDKTVFYRVHNNSVTNKDKKTTKDIFANLLKTTFSRKSDYLNNYINQAGLFKIQYAQKLNKRLDSQLNYFINLKNAPGVIKKINSKFKFYIGKKK